MELEERLDLPYDDEPTEPRRVDLVLPPAAARHGAGIFFVHGGGWAGGHRGQWRGVMRHFAARGYVCASVGYRLLPEARFPEIFADVRTGMAWFRRQAADLGLDAARVASWGSSAGGHLAALLATVGVDDDLGRTPVQQGADTRPAAAVCLCTIFSCHRVGGYYKPDFFGVEEEDAPELYRRASPLDRVDDQTPPLLLVVGDADETTPVAGHEAMVERVCGAGGRAELHILPGVGHGYGYGVETPAQQETLRWAEAFLAPVLGVPETQA